MKQKIRKAEILSLLLAGAMVLFLNQCTPSDSPSTGDGSSATTSNSPALSPGMQISSLVSGGIAGLSDSIQVSDDWHLIVVRRNESFVRRLDGDEQAALREVLGGFANLDYQQDDGANVADGMSSILTARGSGTGSGAPTDAKQLFELINSAAAKGSDD